MILARLNIDHGVHISGTPLWLDADHKRDLCVLTSLTQSMPARHARAVASAHLTHLLGAAGYRGALLPLPWGRRIGLVGHQIELFDAGIGLGFSGALIEQSGASTLYLGLLRRQQALWPRAQCVVANVPAIDHRGESLDATVQQLRAVIAQATASRARTLISIDCVDGAFALWSRLQAFGIHVDVTGFLAKMIHAENVGQPMDVAPSGQGVPSKVILRLNHPTMSRILGTGAVVWVHVDVGLGNAGFLPKVIPDAVLPMAWLAGRRELRDVIMQCRAKKVVLMGIPPNKHVRLMRDFRGVAKLAFLYPAQQLAMGF